MNAGNTKDTLAKIKAFAEDNFAKPEKEQVWAEDEESSLTNPWIDHSGRFPLSDVEAVKEWGLANVYEFCKKAEAHIQNKEQQTAD